MIQKIISLAARHDREGLRSGAFNLNSQASNRLRPDEKSEWYDINSENQYK